MALAKELEKFLKDNKVHAGQVVGYYLPTEVDFKLKEQFGNFEIVREDAIGVAGREGVQDEYVLHFSKTDSYVMIAVEHDSWNGSDWSYADFSDVKPVTITKTIYR